MFSIYTMLRENWCCYVVQTYAFSIYFQKMTVRQAMKRRGTELERFLGFELTNVNDVQPLSDSSC
jgi:hypothetical protein